LSLRTVPIFLFLHLSILFFLNDQTGVLTVMYSGKSWNVLIEFRLMRCFSISMLEKPCFFVKQAFSKWRLHHLQIYLRKLFCWNLWTQKWCRKVSNQLRNQFKKFVSNLLKTFVFFFKSKNMRLCRYHI
jgi:hypothetical protein